MCFSAMVRADFRTYERRFGAKADLRAFLRLYRERLANPRIKIPRAMDAAFANPQSDIETTVLEEIAAFDAKQTADLERELFVQRKRLAGADRTLKTKHTKTASESKRIATAKIERALAQLADRHCSVPAGAHARIFPGHYAPVMIQEAGNLVIRPMRYQCRPAGKPASYDTRYPGTYNARRDNLRGFWREQYGSTHGLMIVRAFNENVSRHALEDRPLKEGELEENVVLEFRPSFDQEMLVACLWSHWSSPGEEPLLSFAAITDEPPPEVAAAGHDRCIVPIKPENIDVWLTPAEQSLEALDAVLADKARPYYEHKVAVGS